jgi:hypothetical protein
MESGQQPILENPKMKPLHMVAYLGLGAFIALTNTVNTMLVSVLNPILSAVKGSYA